MSFDIYFSDVEMLDDSVDEDLDPAVGEGGVGRASCCVMLNTYWNMMFRCRMQKKWLLY